jgi:hypothetical protein
MKIAVNLTVEIDPEQWMREYGVDRSEIREDVRLWVQAGVQTALAVLLGECSTDVSLRE